MGPVWLQEYCPPLFPPVCCFCVVVVELPLESRLFFSNLKKHKKDKSAEPTRDRRRPTLENGLVPLQAPCRVQQGCFVTMRCQILWICKSHSLPYNTDGRHLSSGMEDDDARKNVLRRCSRSLRSFSGEP